MPNDDNSITVNHNRLHKAVLLDALRNIVDLPFIMLFLRCRHTAQYPQAAVL
jgi:hypothetical protein